MKKHIHLHIGTHKTGTTVIQQTLAENREPLKALGYLYPNAGWHQFAQHFLAFQKQGRVNTGMSQAEKDPWIELKQEIQAFDGEEIIISSEEFSTLTSPASITEIRHELADHKVTIYVYLRHQDEMFESIYNQQTKDWLSPRIESIEELLQTPEILYPIFNYYQFLKNWAAVFGQESLVIKDYSQLRRDRIDLITDFLNTVKLPADAIKRPSRPMMNQSVSRKALEIIRLAKQQEFSTDERKAFFDLALATFPEYDGGLLEPTQRKKLLKNYRRCNKKLKEYGLIFNPLEHQGQAQGKPLTEIDFIQIINSLQQRQRLPSAQPAL